MQTKAHLHLGTVSGTCRASRGRHPASHDVRSEAVSAGALPVTPGSGHPTNSGLPACSQCDTARTCRVQHRSHGIVTTPYENCSVVWRGVPGGNDPSTPASNSSGGGAIAPGKTIPNTVKAGATTAHDTERAALNPLAGWVRQPGTPKSF